MAAPRPRGWRLPIAGEAGRLCVPPVRLAHALTERDFRLAIAERGPHAKAPPPSRRGRLSIRTAGSSAADDHHRKPPQQPEARGPGALPPPFGAQLAQRALFCRGPAQPLRLALARVDEPAVVRERNVVQVREMIPDQQDSPITLRAAKKPARFDAGRAGLACPAPVYRWFRGPVRSA